MNTTSLSRAQSEALLQLQKLVHSAARRPTYLLTGPSGVGKSVTARALADAEQGYYWNFVLDGLVELLSVQNPFHLQISVLHQLILERLSNIQTDLVVIDGLEAALTGLMPGRRPEIIGFLRLLQAQTTGRRLVIVLPSQPGSAFLTPTDLISAFEDPGKVVVLRSTDSDLIF